MPIHGMCDICLGWGETSSIQCWCLGKWDKERGTPLPLYITLAHCPQQVHEFGRCSMPTGHIAKRQSLKLWLSFSSSLPTWHCRKSHLQWTINPCRLDRIPHKHIHSPQSSCECNLSRSCVQKVAKDLYIVSSGHLVRLTSRSCIYCAALYQTPATCKTQLVLIKPMTPSEQEKQEKNIIKMKALCRVIGSFSMAHSGLQLERNRSRLLSLMKLLPCGPTLHELSFTLDHQDLRA